MARRDGTASRSGPSTAHAERQRPRVQLSLAPETVATLDALVADGAYPSRSAAVDAAVGALVVQPRQR